MLVVRSIVDFSRANFESQRFQNFHSGHANVRFVIAHKGVVPEDDSATLL